MDFSKYQTALATHSPSTEQNRDQMILHTCGLLPFILNSPKAPEYDLLELSQYREDFCDTRDQFTMQLYCCILDVCRRENIALLPRDCRNEWSGQLETDLLRINGLILNAFTPSPVGLDAGYVLSAIERFSAFYAIPLEKMMDLELELLGLE
jgi:hypothetical protein